LKLTYVAFIVIACFAELSLAGSRRSADNQIPLDKCAIDSDCACVLSADHCGFAPESKNNSRKKRTEEERPACFGPQRYASPKCQQGECICQDAGKAPD